MNKYLLLFFSAVIKAFLLFLFCVMSGESKAHVITQYKVNGIEVKPLIVDGGEPNPDKIKGYDYIPMLYSNIFLCAKKKSGKTNLIYLMLEQFVAKGTEVYIFCSTVNKDRTYDEILNMLEQKKIVHEAYTSFIDPKTGGSMIDEVLQEINAEQASKKQGAEGPPKPQGPKFLEMKSQRPKKPAKEAAERIFVFDDLGAELRHPSVNQLLKTNRHNKCKVILSSQYLTDMQPQAIKQLDFIFLFRSFNQEKLERIYELIDLSVPLEKFVSLYQFATAEPFNFLFVDIRREVFRKNFNTVLSVE